MISLFKTLLSHPLEKIYQPQRHGDAEN